ncbi:MAG: hypothetical protein M5U31_03080 [Acidimicrobiia bacterium]|nr:hypothetical protein [Acidimicrobiia bacterium]
MTIRRTSTPKRRLILVLAAMTAAGMLVAACGSDSDGDSSSDSGGSSGSFEVGDCTTEVSDGSAESVPCDDPTAAFEVVGVIDTSLSGCATDLESFESDGNNICLGEITLDLTTLAVGDCTDSTPDEEDPSAKLPCDDPAATARVVELVEEVPGTCTEGDISYGIISHGTERTICQESL